jgi:hypothetical protein
MTDDSLPTPPWRVIPRPTPKRVSMNHSSDVWSKTSEHTNRRD